MVWQLYGYEFSLTSRETEAVGYVTERQKQLKFYRKVKLKESSGVTCNWIVRLFIKKTRTDQLWNTI